MDLLSTLSKSLLNASTVKKVAAKSGTTTTESKSVMTEALPSLVSSLTGAASGKSAKKSSSLTTLLAGVLASSTVDSNTSSKEDEKLGSSILTTLLGGSSGLTSLLSAVSGKVSLSSATVKKILVAFAPLLLKKVASLVSTNSSAKKSDSLDLTSLLGGLTGTSSSTSSAKKKKTSTSDTLTSVAGSLLSGLTSNKK